MHFIKSFSISDIYETRCTLSINDELRCGDGATAVSWRLWPWPVRKAFSNVRSPLPLLLVGNFMVSAHVTFRIRHARINFIAACSNLMVATKSIAAFSDASLMATKNSTLGLPYKNEVMS